MTRHSLVLDLGTFPGTAESRGAKHDGRDFSDVGPEAIDFVHLRRFTQGDKALEKEVLDLFAAQMPESIAALKKAATDKQWQIAAHTLKGSGRAVGAWRLADLALQAEGVSPSADEQAADKLIQRIELAAQEVQQFIKLVSSRN